MITPTIEIMSQWCHIHTVLSADGVLPPAASQALWEMLHKITVFECTTMYVRCLRKVLRGADV